MTMPYAHPEDHREAMRAASKRWYKNHPEYAREKARNFQRRRWATRPEIARKYQRDYRAKVRERVLLLYGGSCVCCGEAGLPFLTFDHVNGGGSKERRVTGMTGSTFYLSLLKKHREDIQVLCFNCNCAKWNYGVCPHVNK